MNLKKFNPLTFLASIGAGGIAIIPFAYMQYTTTHGPGLVTYSEMSTNGALSVPILMLLSAVMLIFAIIHYGLTVVLFTQYFKWVRTDGYKKTRQDPLKNGGLMVPIISLAMSMNVFIGAVRYFIPEISGNFQSLMLPALVGWIVLWLWMMKLEISLLKISFTKEFDVNKISFGWLLHPFALGMVTVTGTGLAAMAKSHTIADTAAIMSAISGTMGLFLFLVKLISIFKSHFNQSGIPERQFLPSFLIVVPIMTLFAISLFRFGHYMEHRFAFELNWYSTMVILIAFAFETWYLAFGIAMLKDYFKKDFFRKEYYVTLWALICPFVAYAVISSFAFKLFVPIPIFHVTVFFGMITALSMFGMVAYRALRK